MELETKEAFLRHLFLISGTSLTDKKTHDQLVSELNDAEKYSVKQKEELRQAKAMDKKLFNEITEKIINHSRLENEYLELINVTDNLFDQVEALNNNIKEKEGKIKLKNITKDAGIYSELKHKSVEEIQTILDEQVIIHNFK